MEGGGENGRRLGNLLKWAAEIGIADTAAAEGEEGAPSCLGNTLFVSEFPEAGGRGLGACRDIRKGELVLRVPKSALMTTDALLRTDGVLSRCVANHPSLSPVQKLIACLLYEVGKGKDSSWYPYLETLPRSYSTFSAFGKFEMQAFQVDYAVWAAEKARLKVENEWEEARALLQELRLKPRLLTFGSWLWASATVSSRTLHVPWDEAGCLCPVGDLFNYAAPGESTTESTFTQDLHHGDNGCNHMLADDQSDANSRLTDGGYEEAVAAYCFYARQHYEKGEQVLLSYGTYTNLELLEHYGFLLDENPNDRVYLTIKVDTPLSSTWPRESLYIEPDGKPSFALLATLRLWALPPSQRKCIGNHAYSGSPLSIVNEARVLGLMVTSCEEALNHLLTRLKEDRDLLRELDGFDIISGSSVSEISARMAMLCSEEANNFSGRVLRRNGDSNAKKPLSLEKIQLALERWKLAIRWRIMYKRTLLDCISLCQKTINL
ncbi:hypothetical protein MLD38_034632 [Melastoma candidum]|uniref:Uncharacterized protein n=1 Tax=Melastoma candidum TaxID=119954 RepID=A0ACB9MCM2_9MYRT|nr:hypothetical protein MLD38_034632 [Melastoma candidum]